MKKPKIIICGVGVVVIVLFSAGVSQRPTPPKSLCEKVASYYPVTFFQVELRIGNPEFWDTDMAELRAMHGNSFNVGGAITNLSDLINSKTAGKEFGARSYIAMAVGASNCQGAATYRADNVDKVPTHFGNGGTLNSVPFLLFSQTLVEISTIKTNSTFRSLIWKTSWDSNNAPQTQQKLIVAAPTEKRESERPMYIPVPSPGGSGSGGGTIGVDGSYYQPLAHTFDQFDGFPDLSGDNRYPGAAVGNPVNVPSLSNKKIYKGDDFVEYASWVEPVSIIF